MSSGIWQSFLGLCRDNVNNNMYIHICMHICLIVLVTVVFIINILST